MTGCNLIDLGYQGQHFTWHRHIHGFCYLVKRLDKVIASVKWKNDLSNAYVEHLCRLHSNHNLILLRRGRLPYRLRERPFRFEAAWTAHNEYRDMVSTTWSKSKNNAMHGLNEVCRDSINFNKNTFKNIF
jgi:hypothetical protein